MAAIASDRFAPLSLAGTYNSDRASLPEALAPPSALQDAFGQQAFRGVPFDLGAAGAANVALVAEAPLTVAAGDLAATYLVFLHQVEDRASTYPDRLRGHGRGRQRARRPRRRLRAALRRRLRARATDPAPLRDPAGAHRLGGQPLRRRADVCGSGDRLRRGGQGGRQALHRGIRPRRDPARLRPRRRAGPGLALRPAQPPPRPPHRRGRAPASRRALRGVRHRHDRPDRPPAEAGDAAQAAPGSAAGSRLRRRPPTRRPRTGPGHRHLRAPRAGLRPRPLD